MRKLLGAVFCAVLASLIPARGWCDSSVGVLILSQDATPKWVDEVKSAVKEAHLPIPTRVFAGLCLASSEVDQLQKDVRWLEKQGVQKIIVIPLAVSRYTDVYRQWRYLLGSDVKPGYSENNFFAVHRSARIEFTDPLDEDPQLSDMLLERAQEISQNPANEQVFIVAQGIRDDEYNWEWQKTLEHLARSVGERSNFRNVRYATLRDESPRRESIYPKTLPLRAQVEAVNRAGGRVLIIPLLLTPGGLESRIRLELKGVEYTSNPRLLLPDARFPLWIRGRVGM